MVNATSRPLYPRERPRTHCIGGWVGSRAGLDGCGKSPHTGIRSPDRPASSESVYRLSYPGPQPSLISKKTKIENKCVNSTMHVHVSSGNYVLKSAHRSVYHGLRFCDIPQLLCANISTSMNITGMA
jgi:hypothetical protein